MLSTKHRVNLVWSIPLVAASLSLGASALHAQVPPPNPDGPKANWALWEKFSAANMRNMVFSTNITPRWVGETDSMFYSWKDHTGTRWYLVDASKRTKQPLFNHQKLAAQLSNLRNKGIESFALDGEFTSINITKDHKNLRFSIDSTRYNWSIATEKLTELGKYRGAQDSLLVQDEEGDVVMGGGAGRGGGGGRGGATPPQGGGRGGPPDYRNYSPDSSAFVYAQSHNIFMVRKGSNDTLKLTSEGIDKFSFGGGGGRGGGGFQQQDTTQNNLTDEQRAAQPSRANVTWAPDGKGFYTMRTDSRGVKNMWVIRSITEPRPTLLEYSYGMPGEDSIPKPELWTYVMGQQTAKKAPVEKWKDQRIVATPQIGVSTGGRGGGGGAGAFGGGGGQGYWVGKTGSKVRFVRRDRLQRNVEFVEHDVATGETKVLVSDSKGNSGSLEIQSPVYIKEGGDFLWFSERDGFGHYYLYSFDGQLKRQVTSGEWRADQIVGLDSVRNIAWIKGQGREAGENLYNQHLYRVNLNDGTMALVNQGDYNHTATLSSNQKWVVDVASRIDTMPRVTLLSASTGAKVMDLEQTDVSKLEAAGWTFAEGFEVLAADGVTRIFGNMWKPFDFDSTKKYPLIANVYPGPQTESVSGGFGATGNPQQLAQLGFIVIQIGNRGGTPARSAAYQDFGYFNLRDYALADKKAGIEQLAARHSWIDLDRVGIYGHSGGGFLTAAAMLLPPYNEFFKVGVSEAGNHDNNIYNTNWSEQYHGLMWVAASDTARLTAEMRSKGRVSEFQAGKKIGQDEMRTSGRGGNTGRFGGAGGRGGGAGRGGGQGGGNAAAGGGAAGAPQAAVPDSVFWIYVPTNIDIAANLKGKLLINTGDEDNNVSPSNSIRLVNALIQSGKRFDYFIFPGQAHSYGPMAGYAFQQLSEYFTEFLMGQGDFRRSADFNQH